MTSISFSYSRKRLHTPNLRESSDTDSEDEVPPMKLKKKDTGKNLPIAISDRLRNLVVWISGLPVRDYFTMAVKAGSTLPEEEIPEEDVITIKDDDVPEKTNPFLQRFNQSRKQVLSNNGRHIRPTELNGSCTTRLRLHDDEVSCTYDSRYDSVKPKNSSNTWRGQRNANGSYNLRHHQIENPLTIVSNPASDIEILLDPEPESSIPEQDEVKIISELDNLQGNTANSKSLQASAKHLNIENSASLSDSIQRRLTTASKSYTAHEVVRLQEKEQYQLLLQKYIHGNNYNYVNRKPKLHAEVDDYSSYDFSGSHFKKEIPCQPVTNFIEKYCRPCQLLPPKLKPTKEKHQPPEIVIDDDDDEMEIIDVKLPKHKYDYKVNPRFFSNAWIDELKKSVHAQTEERMKIVHDHEKQLERIKKERLLEQLNVEEPPEPEFPELTAEMEEIVDKALKGDPKERLCKDIHRKDVDTLQGLSWLNDLVINSYFDMIVERSKQEGYPSVHAYNTFFYTTYKMKGYASVRRWTRKIDIFNCDLNFVPIHLGVHWCLGVIDHRSKKICYYDSMGNGEEKCMDLLLEYLRLEHKDKKGVALEPYSYEKENMKNIPQQMNGSDCGMFTLKYAEYISRDAEITFTQKDMAYFRRRMIYELITSKLF